MHTKQFSQIVSCTTKIHKDFVSTKFQQLYFFANHVASTRSHASLRSRAPVGVSSPPPSLYLDFCFFYAYARFSILLFNRMSFIFVFTFLFFLVGVSSFILFANIIILSFYSYPYLIGFGDQIRSHKQATAFCETQDFTITHFVMIFFYIYKIYL